MHCVVSVLEMRLHPDQEEKPSLNLWNSRVFREVLQANEARLAIPFVVVVLKVSLIAGFDLVFVCALRMGMRSIPTVRTVGMDIERKEWLLSTSQERNLRKGQKSKKLDDEGVG